MASGGATIGALRVVIGADTASLESGLKSAESSVSRFAKNVTTIAAGIQLEKLLTSAFNSLAHAIKKSVLQADDFGKMAEKVGMPIEQFSALAYAAKLADVPLGTLSTSLVFLSKKMAEAAVPGTKAAKVFETIGLKAIDVRTGALKPLGDMFGEVSTKLAGYTEGAGKNAIAVELLGKAGKELAPLFNQGAAGIKKATDEAARFGLIITPEMVANSQNFKDNMERLGGILDGLLLQIAGPLAQALNELSTRLVDAAGNGDLMKEAGIRITQVINFLIKEIRLLMVNVEGLTKLWAALRNMMNAPLGAAITQIGVETDAALKKVHEDHKAFIETYEKNVRSPWAGEVTTLNNMGNALDRAINRYRQVVPPLLATGDAASKAAKGLREAEAEARKAEAAIAKLMDEGKQIEEAMLPTQKYAAEVKKLNELWAAGAVSAEAYALKLSMIKYPGLTQAVIDAGDFNKQIDSFSVSSVNTIANGLTDIVTGAKSAKEAFTEMARSILRDLINMIIKAMLFQYVVAPLMGLPTGGAGGFVMGAGLPKFAKGGSFKVGGSGPVDSQLVAFRATPGERVDVRTPGQQRDMNQAVNVNAPVRVVNAFDAQDFLSKALGELGGEKVILNFVRANPSAFRAALA